MLHTRLSHPDMPSFDFYDETANGIINQCGNQSNIAARRGTHMYREFHTFVPNSHFFWLVNPIQLSPGSQWCA